MVDEDGSAGAYRVLVKVLVNTVVVVVDKAGGVITDVDVVLAAYGLRVFVAAGTGFKVVESVKVPMVAL